MPAHDDADHLLPISPESFHDDAKLTSSVAAFNRCPMQERDTRVTDQSSMLLRRALLAIADRADEPLSLRECADVARAVGALDTAQLLEELACLHEGFAPPQPCTGAMLDAALRELTQLIRDDTAPVIDDAGEPVATPSDLDLRAACARLVRLMRAPFDEALGQQLAELGNAILRQPVVDLRDHVDADVETLADGLARRSLHAFLAANHPLAFAPLGSPRLLHAAARLGPAGLGPFFRRTGNLLRHGRDLLGLAEVAGAAPDRCDRWPVLLSTHVERHHLVELVDELGDLGRTDTLGAILGVIAPRPRRRDDDWVLGRLRDAALDNIDLPLALRAQRLRARATEEREDWVLLGDIHVAAEEWDAAEAAYAYAIGTAPATAAMRLRLDALRARRQEYAPVGGVETPDGQRHARLARHGVVPPRRVPLDAVAA